MLQDISTANGGVTKFISSPISNQSEEFDYASLYSVFPPKTSLLSSLIPSDCSTEDDSHNTTTIELASRSPLYSCVVIDHGNPLDRHNLCLFLLRKAAREIESLRQENINLRVTNIGLNKRWSLIAQAVLQNGLILAPSDCTALTASSSSSFVTNGFHPMCTGEAMASERQARDEVPGESPASVIESSRVETMNGERVSLPKSISVRFNGYLKTVENGRVKTGRIRSHKRINNVNPVNVLQKVYVAGGKTEEHPVGLEVYTQGMFKTELCNKWQMSGGACSYGDHCQFAHGIGELRPVIRHPRYKTQPCRMILAGDPCPYGHRCHFRHSLTDQERLLRRPFKPTSVNLYRQSIATGHNWMTTKKRTMAINFG
ncbi:hypothetical protein U1Q18_002237 [Sarracenia purpurea var. burkii]